MNIKSIKSLQEELSTLIGVSGYETKIIETLPEKFKGSLPTIKEIEEEFEGSDSDED